MRGPVEEMSGRANVLVRLCQVRDMSLGGVSGWGIIRSGKCPFGQVSVGEVSVGDLSSRGSICIPEYCAFF